MQFKTSEIFALLPYSQNKGEKKDLLYSWADKPGTQEKHTSLDTNLVGNYWVINDRKVMRIYASENI